MSSTPSATPPRRPALPAFLGGGRPPRHALVRVRSLRGLHRLLLLSLVGQLVIIALLLGAGRRGERQQGIGAPGIDLLPRGEGP